ncbi:MAG: 2TM domain-containing protein [Planctomycetaceae bacterium]|nr:2TM domain-containing protein [Planctomycetaceae bacterium]
MNESSNEPATPPVSPPPDSAEPTGNMTEAQRGEKRRGFFIHLIVYVLVIGGLAYLDFSRSPEGKDHWVQWPAMGWGIGIFFHGLGVFLDSRKK